MELSKNVCKNVCRRQLQDTLSVGFERSMHVTADFVRRIGLQAELQGHQGCVNCLEWNDKGTLIASGSDDVKVIIWDPFALRMRGKIDTAHTGNIFSVKFLPKSNDSVIVSGAADSKIQVHDVNAAETTQVFSNHRNRVKRIATAPNVPFMFWSAGEDGMVLQFDLRCPEAAHSEAPQNVLVNLNAHIGANAELKSLSVNPMRPELLAVGANDPYVRMYDRRMLTCKSIKFPVPMPEPQDMFPPSASSQANQLNRLQARRLLIDRLTDIKEFSLDPRAIQYFVPGHLPLKLNEYKKRYRPLASTYLTFSQNGNELLANLGGEQIYLFDVNAVRKPRKFEVPDFLVPPHTNGIVKNGVTQGSNGLHPPNGTTNGVTNGHVMSASSHAAADADSCKQTEQKRKSPRRPLPAYVDVLKRRANAVYEDRRYNEAIMIYNTAILLAPDSPVLYGNRAAAFMKRNWDGDLYAALRDCYSAIEIDDVHLKAHFRLAKCLFELSWTEEARQCLQIFKTKFPDYADSQACLHLDRDITAAISSASKSSPDGESDSDQHSPGSSRSSRGFRSEQRGADSSNLDELSQQEVTWRAQSGDYDQRFCGHCNTTTDIKEANFFGSNGQYIVAGSDDGSFFIWERETTNIVRVLRGDDSIVNCLQPHPSQCLLATSGIDPVVRLWSPRPEDGQKDEREVDNSDDAAAANQRRMNADPLETMLINMGYNNHRLSGLLNSDDPQAEGEGGGIACRPS